MTTTSVLDDAFNVPYKSTHKFKQCANFTVIFRRPLRLRLLGNLSLVADVGITGYKYFFML